MKRRDAGDVVYLLCGCIFLAVGAIFLAACGVMLIRKGALAANGRGDVRFLPLIFGAIGALTAGLGAALLAGLRRTGKRIGRLLERGEYVTADITGFPVDYRVTVNGRPLYRVECSYQDPGTGVLHVFQSGCLSVNPARYVTAQTVRVYVDRESGYRNYYVDVNPILPRVERH